MPDYIDRPQPVYDPHWVMKRDLTNIIQKLREKEPTDENLESLAIYEEILQRFS